MKWHQFLISILCNISYLPFYFSRYVWIHETLHDSKAWNEPEVISLIACHRHSLNFLTCLEHFENPASSLRPWRQLAQMQEAQHVEEVALEHQCLGFILIILIDNKSWQFIWEAYQTIPGSIWNTIKYKQKCLPSNTWDQVTASTVSITFKNATDLQDPITSAKS